MLKVNNTGTFSGTKRAIRQCTKSAIRQWTKHAIRQCMKPAIRQCTKPAIRQCTKRATRQRMKLVVWQWRKRAIRQCKWRRNKMFSRNMRFTHVSANVPFTTELIIFCSVFKEFSPINDLVNTSIKLLKPD